jgi:hypothetical protein
MNEPYFTRQRVSHQSGWQWVYLYAPPLRGTSKPHLMDRFFVGAHATLTPNELAKMLNDAYTLGQEARRGVEE